jgi:hypothetical protein
MNLREFVKLMIPANYDMHPIDVQQLNKEQNYIPINYWHNKYNLYLNK